MSQPELLIFVLNLLTDLYIQYMVTGSVVSSLQGEPRVFDAIDRQSMFIVIDSLSGNKVDFWLLTVDPFDKARFAAHRRGVEVLGLTNFYVTNPENTILSKLRWAKLAGGSEKQLTVTIRVFEMQFERLDIEYIKHWIHQLNLQTQWQLLVDQAEPY